MDGLAPALVPQRPRVAHGEAPTRRGKESGGPSFRTVRYDLDEYVGVASTRRCSGSEGGVSRKLTGVVTGPTLCQRGVCNSTTRFSLASTSSSWTRAYSVRK